MPETISAAFKSRRDAEMAVEHIVQEHGLDRSAVTITPMSDQNSAGTEAARADVEDGHLKSATVGEPALAGKVQVAVDVEGTEAEKVKQSFETYDGEITAERNDA